MVTAPMLPGEGTPVEGTPVEGVPVEGVPVEGDRVESVGPAAPTGGVHRRLPRAVLGELAASRQLLLASARGTVLDLDVTGSLSEVHAAAAAAAAGEDASTGPYDTVVGVAALTGIADLHQAMTGIAALLADDGELLLVEPASNPGPLSMVVATLWSYHPSVSGLHVERDVATSVRSVGLTITDLERLTMPTAIRPLRSFLRLRARRFMASAGAATMPETAGPETARPETAGEKQR